MASKLKSAKKTTDLTFLQPGRLRNSRLTSVELTLSDTKARLIGRDRKLDEVSTLQFETHADKAEELSFRIKGVKTLQGRACLEGGKAHPETVVGDFNGSEFRLTLDEAKERVICHQAPDIDIAEMMQLVEWADTLDPLSGQNDIFAATGVGPYAARRRRFGCARLFFVSVGLGAACGASLGMWQEGCSGAHGAWLFWRFCRSQN